jgi:hypothetical protein
MWEGGALIIIVTICLLNEPIPCRGLDERSPNSIANLAELDNLAVGEIYLDLLLGFLGKGIGTKSRRELTIIFEDHFQCCAMSYHSSINISNLALYIPPLP